jgi:hypothetical protein
MIPLISEVNKAEEEAIPVPFDRSYWIVPGKLLAGAYPGDLDPAAAAKKVHAIVEAGIRCFVDLTSPDDRNMFGQSLNSYQELLGKISAGRFKIIYRRVPIVDLNIPSQPEMVEILDIIDGGILSNIPVYVHCLGGIGRTGTVVGCWLVRHGIRQGQDAIDLVRKLRRNEAHSRIASPETARQRRFVCEWKQGE